MEPRPSSYHGSITHTCVTWPCVHATPSQLQAPTPHVLTPPHGSVPACHDESALVPAKAFSCNKASTAAMERAHTWSEHGVNEGLLMHGVASCTVRTQHDMQHVLLTISLQ